MLLSLAALASLTASAPSVQVAPPGSTAVQAGPGTLLIDRNRIDRAVPELPPTPPKEPAPAVAMDAVPTGRTIKGIRFIGADAPSIVAAAGRPYLGRTIDRKTLTALTSALSAAYEHGHVALYTVSVPNQTFANGIVVVRLVEGSIRQVRVQTAKPDGFALLRARLAPLTKERPLARATFERQLLLAQSIPGTSVTTDFADPEGNGALTLTASPKARRSRLSAGFTNRGVDLLGDGQVDVRADVFGIGTEGDQLNIVGSAAQDLRRFRYLSASYAVPVGADGFTVSANASYVQTRPRRLNIKGEAKQAGIALSYPLVRRFRQSVDLSAAVDGLDSDNATLGNVIAQEHTRAARLAGTLVDARPRRQVSIAASLSRGLDILDARTIAPFAEPVFTKAALGTSINQAIGKRVAARGSVSGQYSRDRLPAAERFAIGGAAIGRAFDTSLLTGDRGLGASGELALRPVKAGKFSASEAYAFVDAGQVTINARDPFAAARYSLASAGVGARARYANRYANKAELGLEIARVLDKPYPSYAEQWRFSLAWRISN